MKKILALTIAFMCVGFLSFAQKLNTTRTFEKALKEATEKTKPILLIVTVPYKTQPQTMNGVKINYTSALEDKEVIEKINENFVVYKTNATDTTVRPILSKSAIINFPSYIFLHPNGEVFFKDFGNFSSKNRYFLMIENALVESKEKSVSELEKDYLTNKNDLQLLKKLIDARKGVGINNNAELIEQYVEHLKVGDFNDYQTVLFILEAGPHTNGSAYKFAYSNRKIIDSIYKKESLQKRMNFNNFMINNTMNDAIKAKNINMAQSAANFTRGTWNSDYQRGAKAYESQMMRYYLAVQDTTHYMQTAIYHYDNYYMRIGADSIKKLEAKERAAMVKRNIPTVINQNIIPKEKLDSLMKLRGAGQISQSIVAVSSTSSSYANELNNAAYKFYEIGTKNINNLSKAMIWSRRSIELNPISGYYDTLAHILYRMGYFEDAVKIRKKLFKNQKKKEEMLVI